MRVYFFIALAIFAFDVVAYSRYHMVLNLAILIATSALLLYYLYTIKFRFWQLFCFHDWECVSDPMLVDNHEDIEFKCRVCGAIEKGI